MRSKKSQADKGDQYEHGPDGNVRMRASRGGSGARCLDDDRVDEDRRVYLVERSGSLVLHFLEHFVCDPRDGLFGYRGTIDFGEMRADLTRR